MHQKYIYECFENSMCLSNFFNKTPLGNSRSQHTSIHIAVWNKHYTQTHTPDEIHTNECAKGNAKCERIAHSKPLRPYLK